MNISDFKHIIFQDFSPSTSYSVFLLDLRFQTLSVRVRSREKCSIWCCDAYYYKYAAGRQNFWNES